VTPASSRVSTLSLVVIERREQRLPALGQTRVRSLDIERQFLGGLSRQAEPAPR